MTTIGFQVMPPLSAEQYESLEQSIRERLFQLPDDTVVHTGHGPDTTIGAEKKAAQGDWL